MAKKIRKVKKVRKPKGKVKVEWKRASKVNELPGLPRIHILKQGRKRIEITLSAGLDSSEWQGYAAISKGKRIGDIKYFPKSGSVEVMITNPKFPNLEEALDYLVGQATKEGTIK